MVAAIAIPVEEYLHTSYEPDMEYVNGRLVERNVGEYFHSMLQLLIGAELLKRSGRGFRAFTEQRVRISAEPRYRIPDICVFLEFPNERIPSKPPFLCIEILSPEDRMQRVQARINGYFEMGVPYVWILDPQTKRAYAATAADSLHEVEILRTDSPILELLLNEILA